MYASTPVFILGLSGANPPPLKKNQKSPQNFKMNYAKIEFLKHSGVIFSPASGGFAPRPPPGLCNGPDLPLHDIWLVDSEENH